MLSFASSLVFAAALASPDATTRPSSSSLPSSSRAPEVGRRRVPGAAAVALTLGAAGLWGGTVVLRARVWAAVRRLQQCETSSQSEKFLGCLGPTFDAMISQAGNHAWSYATAIPAAVLMGGAGFFAGAAARRPPNPRVIRAAGLSLVGAGTITWALPRLMLPRGLGGGEFGGGLRILDATFYSGLGAVGLGAALLAFSEGGRAGQHRRHPTLQAVSLTPRGISVRGAF